MERRAGTLGMAVLGLLLGVGVGLWAGWIGWPLEYASVTPEMLGNDYQNDYAILVATAYEAHGSIERARNELARLGPAAETMLRHAVTSDASTRARLDRLITGLDLETAVTPTPDLSTK